MQPIARYSPLETGVASEDMKSCSTSLVIWEVLIKMTARFYFSLIRLAKIERLIIFNVSEGEGKGMCLNTACGQHIGAHKMFMLCIFFDQAILVLHL